MTSQVARLIDKLKAAGIPRRAFSVQVTRKYLGGEYRGQYEYGDPQIRFHWHRITRGQVAERAQQLADQGLVVAIYRRDARDADPTVIVYQPTDGTPGRVEDRNVRALERAAKAAEERAAAFAA